MAPPAPCSRWREGEWLVNPGSVGQPRDGDPRASYLMLDTDDWTAAFHRVEYPIHQAAERDRGGRASRGSSPSASTQASELRGDRSRTGLVADALCAFAASLVALAPRLRLRQRLERREAALANSASELRSTLAQVEQKVSDGDCRGAARIRRSLLEQQIDSLDAASTRT